MTGSQCHTVGRTDTDSRRTAHHHILNALRNAGSAFQGYPVLLRGQQALIKQLQTAAMPPESNRTYGTGRRRFRRIIHGMTLVS